MKFFRGARNAKKDRRWCACFCGSEVETGAAPLFVIGPRVFWMLGNGLITCVVCGRYRPVAFGRLKRFLWFRLGFRWGFYKASI